MKSIRNLFLFSFSAIATIATFTLSITNNSLDSLRANAGESTGYKCVPHQGVDCYSDNGNIYLNYKKGKIGTVVNFIETSN